MSQQVFAHFIELSPATLSSIFNGRTRPTLNMVEAIKRKFPNINTNWLLFGTGTMFESEQPATAEQEYGSGDDSRGVAVGNEPTLDFDAEPQTLDSTTPLTSPYERQQVQRVKPKVIREEIKYVERPQRHVTEIRVYYDDLTYETFVPAKK